jgi:hypothetical protein
MPGFRNLALSGMATVGLMLGVATLPAQAAGPAQVSAAVPAPAGEAAGDGVLLVHDHWRRGRGYGYGRPDYYRPPPPPRYYGYDRPRYYHPPPRVYYPPPPRYYRPPPGVYFSY